MVTYIDIENKHSLLTECRNIQLAQIVSNIRSLIDVANGLEFERYEAGSIQSIDRFSYLSQLV